MFDGSGAAIGHTTLRGDHGHPGSTLTTLPVSYPFRFTDVPDEDYYKIKDDLGLSWAFSRSEMLHKRWTLDLTTCHS